MIWKLITPLMPYWERLRDNLVTYRNSELLFVLITIVFVSSGLSLAVNVLSSGDFLAWLEGWLQNFSTEIIGAVVTFVLFETIVNRRERQHDARISALGKLSQANTPEEHQIIFAEMKALRLLYHADFEGANFRNAKFTDTSFRFSNLVNANLQGADLRRTSLRECDLRGANLEDVIVDQGTKLPDGTYWTPETDLGRFTNPDHPNFWRSDSMKSPAFMVDKRKIEAEKQHNTDQLQK